MTKPGESWVVMIHLETDHVTAEAFAVALADFTDAQMEFEIREDVWAAKGYAAEKPELSGIETVIAIVAAGLNMDIPEVTLEHLNPIDWVARVYEGFKPIHLGRFYIYGSHLTDPLPASIFPLEINAATAFGTGDHGSTSGCLLALDDLLKRRRFRKVLDVGTGTGVLAMAAVRAGCPMAVATDIDRQAVAVAKENIRQNRLQHRISTGWSNGPSGGLIAGQSPYDLVFANILARPLERMSRDLARQVAPGGYLVLAGLLNRQAARVNAAYRRQGMVLQRKIARGIWTTLVIRRPG